MFIGRFLFIYKITIYFCMVPVAILYDIHISVFRVNNLPMNELINLHKSYKDYKHALTNCKDKIATI